MNFGRLVGFSIGIASLWCCSNTATKARQSGAEPQAAPVYFQVDPATAGTLTGIVRFTGRKPAVKKIDMNQDADCARQHQGRPVADESVVVNSNRTLANVFVYLKTGLEDKKFAAPSNPVTIDQNGCWFQPRVLGIQTGQTLKVTNSDPVTHNVHPLAEVNREWNQSQSGGDPPLTRRFLRPEVMIRVKCNIHKWMHGFIGVLDHPYFAVTGSDGSFRIKDVPPGTYTLAAWQETMGAQEQSVTVAPSGEAHLAFTFKGE